MESKTLISSIRENIGKVMVGSEETIDLLLTALIAEGHVLIEDVPGMGKTVLAKSLAKSVSLEFNRIQFTPDLLPSDVTGLNYFDQKANDFVFSPGPAFCNLLLADEINRATPRTQSSLLECMGERQITVDGVTRPLSAPFFVIATQNPIETLGTYPLPEAQLDRFLMRISMASPTKEQERAILQRFMKEEPLETLQSVCTRVDILALQKQAKEIYIHPVLLDYMIDLVQLAEYRYGRQPARQPCARPCRARLRLGARRRIRRAGRHQDRRRAGARPPFAAQRLRRLHRCPEKSHDRCALLRRPAD